MAQTFDIRFAKTAGLAGFLEAPANEYRWKGAGRLSIDAQGISIAVQRGLLTLFARHRSRRIAADNLIEVYREGDALRLEFSTPESARTVLPFWVRDSNAGAEIVRLLPTQHSVELEEAPGSARRYRFDRAVAAMLLVAIVVLVLGAVMLQRFLAPPSILAGTEDSGVAGEDPVAQAGAPDATPKTLVEPVTTPASAAGNPRSVVDAPAAKMPAGVAAPMPSAPVELDPPDPFASTESPETAAVPVVAAVIAQRVEATRPRVAARPTRDGVIPIVPGDPGYDAARTELDTFLAECDVLEGRRSGQPGMSADWWEVTTRIHNNPELDEPALWGLRDIELAISRSRRAFDYEFADMLESRARQFVR